MQEFVLLPSIMGRVPKSHSIHVQNPTKSPFSNKDLVWTSGIHHGGQNKVTIQLRVMELGPYGANAFPMLFTR